MSLRGVCGLGVALRGFKVPPNARCFHVSAQKQTQDLAGMFSEVFSADPTPDKINTLMNMIHTEAPHNVTSFNLLCRAFTDRMDRWSIKGLRISPRGNTPRRRSVVIVSGLQAFDRIPIGVSLFVAAALSRRPIEGVEVTVFPVMKPKEYELEWRHKQAREVFKSHVAASGIPIKLCVDEHQGVDGTLRSYVLKRSTNFIDVGMDLHANSSSTMKLKSNSLARPLERAEGFMHGIASGSRGEHLGFPVPKFAGPGEGTLFGTMCTPPALILELRDKSKALDEEHIRGCGEQVLAALDKLIADTDIPRGFVL